MHQKLYSRARPYIDIKQIISCLNGDLKHHNDTKELYFSSGRAALKWLLFNLKIKNNKTLNIGVQAFTCPTVIGAILSSGNTPIFYDISQRYFTTLYRDINFSKIDVLILTHLFGIPNPDYLKIVERCKEDKIYLLDDLAQTVGACLGGRKVGYDSNAAIYSFGFDKPISCYRGGLLRVNETGGMEDIIMQYYNVSNEDPRNDGRDLLKLFLYYMLNEPIYYRYGLSAGKWYDDIILTMWNKFHFSYDIIMYPIRGFEFITTIRKKYGESSEYIDIYKLGPIKTTYIKNLWKSYEEIKLKRLKVAQQARKKLEKVFPTIIFPKMEDHMSPAWHRLPVLVDKREVVIDWGRKNAIEIGPFNWPELAFKPYSTISSSNYLFPHSTQVTRKILNLPIWDEAIWK
jgi:dTDP-4-amino-4,6-dideoxygalactose transaminase